MIEFLIGLAALVPTTLAGSLLVRIVDYRGSLRAGETVALGYGIGAGLLAWEMLCFQILGWQFSLLKLWLPMIGVCGLLYGIRPRITAPKLPSFTRAKYRRLETLVFLGISFQMILIFGRALSEPMEAYDAVSNWGLKAKAIFLAQSIPADFLKNPEYRTFHPDYPLLIPLLESSIYFAVGGISDTVSKSIFPFYLLSCAALFHVCLRRAGLSLRTALIFTFFMVSVPFVTEQATNGYADIVICFYFGISSLFLFLWLQTENVPFLTLSALLAGFAALTKNEGLVLGLILTLGLLLQSVRRRRGRSLIRIWQPALTYVSIWVFVALPWLYLKVSLDLRNDVVNATTLSSAIAWSSFERIVPILYHFQTQVFGPKNWNVVWIVFLAALILRWRNLSKRPATLILGSAAATLLCYASIYLVTPYTVAPYDVTWHLRTSASRLLLHVLPLVLFMIALAFGEHDENTVRVH